MQAYEKTWNIRDARTATISAELRDAAGTPTYLVECGSSSSGEPLTYTEDWECFIVPLEHAGEYKPRYSSILASDPYQDRAWFHDGKFDAREYTKQCHGKRECEIVKTFDVRGMRLELGISRATLGSDGGDHAFRTLAFRVRVQPDSAALRSISASALLPEARGSTPFPEMARRTYTARVPPIGAKVPNDVENIVRIPILDRGGRPAYEFRCAMTLDYLEDRRAYVLLSRALPCGLYEPGRQDNLIESRDPVTLFPRSDIQPWQLVGECARYPDWGRTREFRLRGFVLNVTMTDIEVGSWDDLTLVAATTLTLTVTPDPKATCSVAERSRTGDWRVARPNFGCGQVRPTPSELAGCPDAGSVTPH